MDKASINAQELEIYRELVNGIEAKVSRLKDRLAPPFGIRQRMGCRAGAQEILEDIWNARALCALKCAEMGK